MTSAAQVVELDGCSHVPVRIPAPELVRLEVCEPEGSKMRELTRDHGAPRQGSHQVGSSCIKY